MAWHKDGSGTPTWLAWGESSRAGAGWCKYDKKTTAYTSKKQLTPTLLENLYILIF